MSGGLRDDDRLVLPERPSHLLIFYTQALTLLLNLLTAGTSSPTPLPAFTPPPQHLSLAATLVVHPSLTTRARSPERLQTSNIALRLLRHTNKLVGPLNGDFDTAFAFTYFNTSRRGGNGRRRTADDYSPSSGDDPDIINSEIANSGSVWARAEDFWQVVGWAFNCSVMYPKRWERWKLWLEFIIDVLEDDWVERENVSVETEKNPESSMERSLIAKYLQLEGGKMGGNRRVVRAVFADGGAKAMNEFTEVFKNETKTRKKDDGGLKKREAKVDVEEEIFGDYLEDDDDDEEDVEDDTETSEPVVNDENFNTDENVANGAESLGGMDSLILRQRLLALLSAVSDTIPKKFMTVGALYDLYLDHIRPLPVPTFQLLVSPSALPYLSPVARSSLTQFILRSLIASSAPNPSTDDLNQDMLEQNFLPYTANTSNMADNAKVSLLVETLLKLLDKHIGLNPTTSLSHAVRAGITAREKKVNGDRKKKGSTKKEEEADRVWLNGSANRMRALLEMFTD
ncbi:MAG: hypothetical protein M1830_000148 [Pleopsidium flavum]|nr:MAG: hypothetical protein M1830_000148 [Pleopsidium flavum]